jgi:hypothetical protein
VTLQFAPLPYNGKILGDIEVYVKQNNIQLVLVDTLPAWWGLRDENNASEVISNCRSLLQCIRNTDAGWLMIVHTRKGGGQHGEEVRGSSALLGAVDIAVTMKREGNGPRRLLSAVSRFAATPREVTVEFQDNMYVCLGDSGAVLAKEMAEIVFDALSGEQQTRDDLAAKLGMSPQAVGRSIVVLGSRVNRVGEGIKGDPYKYSRNAISPQSEP